MENIKKTFFEVNFFSQPFKKALVTVVSNRYTPVPEAYFEKGKSTALFEFNFHARNGKVLDNWIADSRYHILFDLDEEIYSFLSRNLWNPSFCTYTAHLLPFFAGYHAESGRKRCFVDFHDEMVTVSCFSDRKLLSVNTYPNKNRFDALYHIVNVWEKLPLDQNTDLLLLSGSLPDNRESADLLRKLVRNVDEIEITPTTTIPENEKQLPTDILLQLCE